MPELPPREISSGDESDGGRERAEFHPMLSEAELEAEREREMQQRRTASERERARMKDMNKAYEALRTKLSHRREPGKKLSKIQCLKFAIEYISDLEESLTMSYNERTATGDYFYWARTRGYIWAKEKAAQMPDDVCHPPVTSRSSHGTSGTQHSPVNNNNNNNMCSSTHPPAVLSPPSPPDTTAHGFDPQYLQGYSTVSLWTLRKENNPEYDVEVEMGEWNTLRHETVNAAQRNLRRYDSELGTV